MAYQNRIYVTQEYRICVSTYGFESLRMGDRISKTIASTSKYLLLRCLIGSQIMSQNGLSRSIRKLASRWRTPKHDILEGGRRVQLILRLISETPETYLKGQDDCWGLAIRVTRNIENNIHLSFYHPNGPTAAADWGNRVLYLLSPHLWFTVNVVKSHQGFPDDGMFDQSFPWPSHTWIVFDVYGTPLVCVGSARSVRVRNSDYAYTSCCSGVSRSGRLE